MNFIEELVESLVSGIENIVHELAGTFLKALTTTLRSAGRMAYALWIIFLLLAAFILTLACFMEMGSADAAIVRWFGWAMFILTILLFIFAVPKASGNASEPGERHGVGWSLLLVNIVCLAIIYFTASIRPPRSFLFRMISGVRAPQVATTELRGSQFQGPVVSAGERNVNQSTKRADRNRMRRGGAPASGVGANAQESSFSGELPCSSEAGIRSGAAGEPVEVRIANESSETLNLYWINSHGDRVTYDTLPPGEIDHQRTFQGHAWLLANQDGVCRLIFVVNSGMRNVTAR